jgi:hypothetical protein
VSSRLADAPNAFGYQEPNSGHKSEAPAASKSAKTHRRVRHIINRLFSELVGPAAPGPGNSMFLASGPLRHTYAEGVQHRSPGQTHASETSVSAALGQKTPPRIGRAVDFYFGGRACRGRNEACVTSPKQKSRHPGASNSGQYPAVKVARKFY